NRILDSITLLKSIELKGTTRQLSQPAVTYNMELTFKDEKHMNREVLRDKKRIVVKVGSSSLTHKESGDLNFRKLEQLVRVLA
ncbi:hypothetical protein PT100_08875, partial [Erysipelothrix rhusiopathiae]|nr:hypothetical protein [Erysipelothrix rhusiopathiae]